MSQLTKRIITAAFLIPLVVLVIFYLPLPFFAAIITLITLMAAWEMANLFWQKQLWLRIIFIVCISILSYGVEMLPPLPVLILAGLWWLSVPYFLSCYKQDKYYFSNYPIQFSVGVLTFIPFLAGVLVLRFLFGPLYLLFVLIIIWAADIGAYFSGRFWGKHLLAEKISPKKTIEGVMGGLIAALIIASIAGFVLRLNERSFAIWLLLTIVVVLWSVVGDLFESMLKRVAGVKDSSHLLPGHGGIYDRIDSLTAAIPIFSLGLLVLGV